MKNQQASTVEVQDSEKRPLVGMVSVPEVQERGGCLFFLDIAASANFALNLLDASVSILLPFLLLFPGLEPLLAADFPLKGVFKFSGPFLLRVASRAETVVESYHWFRECVRG